MPLPTPLPARLRIGDWTVTTATGLITRGDASAKLDERTLRLLLCLAGQAGEVLSMETLLAQVWQGVVVTPDSVYQAITALRRQLGDDPKNPSYIATVPRRGYRLLAKVDAIAGTAAPATVRAPASWKLRTGVLLVLAAGLAAVTELGSHATADVRTPPAAGATNPRSLAVLPFQDLSDAMNEEAFADGMAEELIGKLSKIPRLAVAPPATSYYGKDKRDAAAEVAKALHVAYVLDGSVRKSGPTLRVAARLTRASDGFVVWSDSYDRAAGDKLRMQDSIADAVSQALAKAIP